MLVDVETGNRGCGLVQWTSYPPKEDAIIGCFATVDALRYYIYKEFLEYNLEYD